VVRVAGRLSEYRALLRESDDWAPLLLERSGLPGPRANLELARVAAEEAPPERLREWAAGDEEYLALVGTIGLTDLELLRAQANDPRWRVREGVAMALQRLGFDAILPAMRDWATGTPLERRAVVGGLCEPALLDTEARAVRVLELLDDITAGVEREPDRRSDGFKALRKALGYGWSVAVAAAPGPGRERMARRLDADDRDIAWIMRENLRKKRIQGIFGRPGGSTPR
jgi:hypothetical protein